MKKDFMTDPTIYKFDYEFYIFFETPIERLKTILPDWIQAIEIRPGIGLIAMGGIRFLEGNLAGKLPEFYEPNISIVIQPNLGTNMPIPRLSLYTFNVTSNSVDFLNHCKEIDKMPVYYPKNFKISADSTLLTYECADEAGPIMSFKANNNKRIFEDIIMYVQVIRQLEGKFYLSCVKWEGCGSEVQQPINTNYKLFNLDFHSNNYGSFS